MSGPFKMKNPILMSGRMGSPIQQSYSPMKDTGPTGVDDRDAMLGSRERGRNYEKTAAAKKREELTDASTVDSATAEAKSDHVREQRSYDAENQSSNVDDLGDKESVAKNRPSPTGVIKGLKKLYDVYRRYKHRLKPPKGGGPGRNL